MLAASGARDSPTPGGQRHSFSPARRARRERAQRQMLGGNSSLESFHPLFGVRNDAARARHCSGWEGSNVQAWARKAVPRRGRHTGLGACRNSSAANVDQRSPAAAAPHTASTLQLQLQPLQSSQIPCQSASRPPPAVPRGCAASTPTPAVAAVSAARETLQPPASRARCRMSLRWPPRPPRPHSRASSARTT